MALDTVERTLLSAAVEDTTWLVEFANGIDERPYGPFVSGRAAMGTALLSLLNRQLIVVGTSRWNAPIDASAARISEPELRTRLADGSAWDPDRDDLIVMEATQAGQDLLI